VEVALVRQSSIKMHQAFFLMITEVATARMAQRADTKISNSSRGAIRYDTPLGCAHELCSRTVLRAAILPNVRRIDNGA
jgi:hypothetical protein